MQLSNVQVGKDSTSFGNKYKTNANQKMPTPELCLKRDYALGILSRAAKNGEEINDKFLKFVYKDQNAPLELVFEMDDSLDSITEETLNALGQKFDKIV